MIIFVVSSIGSISCDPQPPVKIAPARPVQQKPTSPAPTTPTPMTPAPTTPTPMTPAQDWESWVGFYEKIGYTVVDAVESSRWIAEHRNELSLPDNIGFKEDHFVEGEPFIGIIITTDHTGKHRIITRQWPLVSQGSSLSLVESFKKTFRETHTLLSHNESLNWLRRNGYDVRKVNNGYSIIRKSSAGSIDFSIESPSPIMRDVYDTLGNAIPLLYDGKGNLCIAVPK